MENENEEIKKLISSFIISPQGTKEYENVFHLLLLTQKEEVKIEIR